MSDCYDCRTCECKSVPQWKKQGFHRFEYKHRKSDKFWQIKHIIGLVTISFGRTGTAGVTQVKEFSWYSDAAEYVARMISEKLNKGYVEVDY